MVRMRRYRLSGLGDRLRETEGGSIPGESVSCWMQIRDQLVNLNSLRDNPRLRELIVARGLQWLEVDGVWYYAEIPPS